MRLRAFEEMIKTHAMQHAREASTKPTTSAATQGKPPVPALLVARFCRAAPATPTAGEAVGAMGGILGMEGGEGCAGMTLGGIGGGLGPGLGAGLGAGGRLGGRLGAPGGSGGGDGWMCVPPAHSQQYSVGRTLIHLKRAHALAGAAGDRNQSHCL
jgi:hypothetical protein